MVVGWSPRFDIAAAIVIDVFAMAVLWRRLKGTLLLHSDHGIQYCSASFIATSLGALPLLVRSIFWKGDCWDSVCKETYSRTLRRQLDELAGTSTWKRVNMAKIEFIEAY
jgi:putative transposase